MSAENTIVYQGEPGANSQIACQQVYPDMTPRACATFEEAFAAISDGEARLGMIPIENSLAGRVADIHHLMPESGLYIIGEHFLRIRFALMAPKGAKLENIKTAQSHVMALGQCRKTLNSLGILGQVAADTAGSAREVAELGDVTHAALATPEAADIYGLDILKTDMEDADHNTTRFLIMAAEPDDATPEEEPVITSFIFRVRNVPAALYKAMGGFATNGVNMTKLESYQVAGSFNATQFYADIEGHPDRRNVRLALEELQFFCSELKILGIYPASKYRAQIAEG